MALLLQRNLKTGTKPHTSLFHRLFSTSNSGGDGGDQGPPKSDSRFSSLFRDLKANLKQPSSSPTPSPLSSKERSTNFSLSGSPRSQNDASVDAIKKSLSMFGARTSVPPPGDASSSPSSPEQPITFQDMYKRRLQQNPLQPPVRQQPGNFDVLREHLRNIDSDGIPKGRISSPAFRDALRPKPVIGGTSAFPESFVGKEGRQRKDGEMKTVFMRSYRVEELGEKLRMLRPEERGKNWFSLAELNERLARLREMEENEAHSNTQERAMMKDVKNVLIDMYQAENEQLEKAKKHKMNILRELGNDPLIYLLQPPKELLVEKYFHPDNMSSAEKLKIELTKVREEFKMSESDCGSARVQVAQLTTKIKHLSAVLHKKDVHSRKGLLAMVQKRKRLLKYLRRTDWESYCFVIFKLGLRDNPDYKI